jgi:hypothetical protein
MPRKKLPSFSDHEVRVRAFRIWQKQQKPESEAEGYWRQALDELQAESRNGGLRPDG